jgi:hypothetical protein
MPRALKNLDVSLGLAVIPVQLFTATSSQGVAFHLLHAKCGSRIQMRLECPIHGIVPREETVKGYEIAKDEYVRFEPEELKVLEQASSSMVVIDSFVPEGADRPGVLRGHVLPRRREERGPWVSRARTGPPIGHVYRAAGVRGRGAPAGLPGLDGGLLIHADDHVALPSQRLGALVERQDRDGPFQKARVSRPLPAVVLPGLDAVGPEPALDGRA